MNKDQVIVEWLYRFDERLGILCEDRNPTWAQLQIAFMEADDWWYENNS